MNKQKRQLVMWLVLFALAMSGVVQAQDEVVTLVYWDWHVTQGESIDRGIAEFEEAFPNIRVEKVTQLVDRYGELVTLAYQSESAPDIYMIPNENSVPWATVMANDWLLPLNGFEDFEAHMATYPHGAFAPGVNVIDGNTYSAPWDATMPWLHLFINTALYEEAGLVDTDGNLLLPKTLDDVIQHSRVIQEQTGKYGVGFSSTQSNTAGWWWTVCQYSAPYAPVGGLAGMPSFDLHTGKHTFASQPCFQQMLEGLVLMRDEDLILPETVAFAIDDEGARAMFAEGEFAHLLGGNWVIGGWASTHPAFTAFTAVPVPLVGVDEPISYFYSRPGGRWMGINAQTDYPEEAWEFYKFMNSERFGQIWAEGGNGLSILSPGDPAQYATNDAWGNIFASSALRIPGPRPEIRNPQVAEVAFTLIGPNENDVLLGIFSGQITDINATLVDLDERYTAALEQAIADAQAAGLDVSIEDYMFEDWDPTQPYVTTPAEG